jgi:hypothetical protein
MPKDFFGSLEIVFPFSEDPVYGHFSVFARWACLVETDVVGFCKCPEGMSLFEIPFSFPFLLPPSISSRFPVSFSCFIQNGDAFPCAVLVIFQKMSTQVVLRRVIRSVAMQNANMRKRREVMLLWQACGMRGREGLDTSDKEIVSETFGMRARRISTRVMQWHRHTGGGDWSRTRRWRRRLAVSIVCGAGADV